MRHVCSCVLGAILPLLAACPADENVPCNDNSDCDLTTGGACTPAESGHSWCAYPDSQCDSGLRFSDKDVGDDLGGVCVPGDGPPARYTLTVNFGGSGEGGVTATPSGLTCSAGTCTGMYDEGTVVDLSATATSGMFLGWSNACTGQGACSVTMNRDQSVGALFGTPGQAIWALQVGSDVRDYGNAIAVDGASNVIVAGEFSGQVTLGTTTLEAADGTDIFVAKISSTDGSVVWAKRFGGVENDTASDVAVDAADNIYVSGQFLGSVDFGGGAISSGTLADAFVLKLAPDGSYGWARKFGGNQFDGASTGIAVRGTNVVLATSFVGTIVVDSMNFMSAGSTDILVASLATSTGTSNWVKKFGGGLADTPRDVAIDSADNVIIVGKYAGTVNFGGGAMSTPGDFDDVLLLKLAGATGAHLMSQHFGGTDHDDGYAVAVDSANNIFIAGDFLATGSFGCTGSLTASQANLRDGFIAKYTQAGSCVWAKGVGGAGAFDRSARDLSVNANGDVAVTGSFCGTLSLGGPTLTAAGSCPALDVYAARFANDGTHLNSVRVGGTGSEFGTGVAQAADGRFFTTGGFQGLAEFGGTAFTSAGADDGFVVGLEAL